jgi:hypothetical protein
VKFWHKIELVSHEMSSIKSKLSEKLELLKGLFFYPETFSSNEYFGTRTFYVNFVHLIVTYTTPSGNTISIKIDGTWKAGTPFMNIDGSWKAVPSLKINVESL